MYIGSLRSDLISFSRFRDAEHKLPRIISALIRTCAGKIHELDFPSDKGVYTRGFDGFVRLEQPLYPMLPDGESVWELKCHWEFSEVKRDYQKRTQTTNEAIRKRRVYVAVFFRDKEYIDRNWFDDVRKKKEWKDVILFALNEIIEWITASPAALIGVIAPILELDLPGNIRKTSFVSREYFYSLNGSQRTHLKRTAMGSLDIYREVVDWFTGSKEVPLAIVADSAAKSIYLYHQLLSEYEHQETYGWVIGEQKVWNMFIDGRGIKDTILIPKHSDYNYSIMANEQGYSLMIPVSYRNMDSVHDAVLAIWKG